jgi:site-specific DNA-methyltransferase (adenine-specific)
MGLTPYYEQSGVTIYHGDCRVVMAEWPNPCDFIVTDPPYGTGGWRRGEAGNGSNPAGSLVREAWDDGAVDWLQMTDAPVLTFWPAAHTEHLLVRAAATGRTKHRALYMRKLDPKPQVSGRVRWSMEPIWVLSRDGFVLYGGDDVVDATTPRVGRDGDANGHPYQKPEHVMAWLIAKLPPGSVLDLFMGSGTTLVAAKRLGRRAIGIEADEQWCEIAAKRLQQEALPLEVA